MLREAERRLTADGIKPRFVRKTTAGAKPLLDKKEFWHLRGAGLAMFAYPEFFRYYLLPNQEGSNRLTIGQGFDVEPLVKILEDD
jgi:hypothetical protein